LPVQSLTCWRDAEHVADCVNETDAGKRNTQTAFVLTVRPPLNSP
jgi:hypothetical protein